MAGKVTTVKSISANAIHNAGGTIVYAGTPSANSPITKSLGIETVGMPAGEASRVPGSGATTFVVAANTLRDFAKMTPGRYILLGDTHYLGGVASTALATPAADPKGHVSINRSQHLSSVHASAWNWVTGKPGSTAASDDAMWSIANGAANVAADQAATPTRSVPGELVILENGQVPTLVDYQKKTG